MKRLIPLLIMITLFNLSGCASFKLYPEKNYYTQEDITQGNIPMGFDSVDQEILEKCIALSSRHAVFSSLAVAMGAGTIGTGGAIALDQDVLPNLAVGGITSAMAVTALTSVVVANSARNTAQSLRCEAHLNKHAGQQQDFSDPEGVMWPEKGRLPTPKNTFTGL